MEKDGTLIDVCPLGHIIKPAAAGEWGWGSRPSPLPLRGSPRLPSRAGGWLLRDARAGAPRRCSSPPRFPRAPGLPRARRNRCGAPGACAPSAGAALPPRFKCPGGSVSFARLPPAPVPAAPPGSPVRCAPGARLPPALLGSVVAPPAGAGSCLAGVRCRGAGAARLWLVPAPGGCVPRSGPRPPPPCAPLLGGRRLRRRSLPERAYPRIRVVP